MYKRQMQTTQHGQAINQSCNLNFSFLFQSKINNSSPSFFCLLYTSPSPRDRTRSRMPSSA
ncbi:hypothetical protein PVA38_10965 [Streptococcus pneumoniae D39]|nr:hypothetical protein PVA38_10965 [Streptococcus pneumoniae D39]